MSAEDFNEAVARGVDAPLRQGDVIEAVAADSSAWTRYLLVLTADCDLANQKNAGRITCIPLLPAEDYLLALLLPEHRDKAVHRLAEDFNDDLKRRGKRGISIERLIEWVGESGFDEILEALEIDQSNGGDLLSRYDGIRFALEPVKTLDDAVANIVAAQQRFAQPKSAEKLSAAMRDVLSNRFRQPPGDSLFLGKISPGYEAGYFAYLRHIEQVWEQDISLSAARSPSAYRRIGALSDRFTHAVVQRFAMVFMPIGLPVEYERIRDSYASDFGRLVV
ncbi:MULTISPECIES: hypothetical protein [Microbacterium]|uniref:hypothetical protein n=1 Tax=Microbacterium TaxID=33882 RepID=UPI000AB14FEF|nr:hypothetical protein [Microbacterium testaceum]